MKKVFLCAILASLSYPAIASSLQDQLSAVAEAEQQGKNEEQRQHDEWVAERNREIQQEKQRRANAQAAANKRFRFCEVYSVPMNRLPPRCCWRREKTVRRCL